MGVVVMWKNSRTYQSWGLILALELKLEWRTFAQQFDGFWSFVHSLCVLKVISWISGWLSKGSHNCFWITEFTICDLSSDTKIFPWNYSLKLFIFLSVVQRDNVRVAPAFPMVRFSIFSIKSIHSFFYFCRLQPSLLRYDTCCIDCQRFPGFSVRSSTF